MSISDNSYAGFTICNIAYLPKALVLAESYLKYNKRKLIIYICDRRTGINNFDNIADIRWIEDLGVPNLYELAFKYDITEFSTSLKPFITIRLLSEYDKVIFLDPDTCLYNSIKTILETLNNHFIILTPHYTTPEPDAYLNSDIGMMRFGSFNLGFYAVKNSKLAIDFLSWWHDRCQRFCFFETQFGLSTDQKWVSLAPCFFQGIHVSFNLGYNVAFWNVRERWISKSSTGEYIVNNTYPLIFFHFSSFDDKNPVLLTKRPLAEDLSNREDLHELCFSYSNSLKKYQWVASSYQYSFDHMSNGDYISPTLRRAYSCVANELPSGHDPFDSDGPVGRFARRNYLLGMSAKPYIPSGFNDIATHKYKFFIINILMRILLRIIGPNRFSDFSRLLIYLSSYRQNRQLWKL